MYDAPRFLTTAEAARYLGLGVHTLQYCRRTRRGPPFRKFRRQRPLLA